MGGARRSSSPRSTPACSGPACKRSIRIRCPRPRRPSVAPSTPSMPPPKPLSPKPTSHRKLRHVCADSPETRQLVDLLATFQDLTGVPTEERLPNDGASLLPLLEGGEDPERTVYAEMHVEASPVPCFMV